MSIKYYIVCKGLDNISSDYLYTVLSSFIEESDKFIFDIDDNEVDTLRKDIIEKNPNIIISLGSEVSEILYKKFKFISNSRGKLLNYADDTFSTKLIITYSPKYLLSETSNMDKYGSVFIKDIEYAVKYVKGELVDVESKYITYAKTYEEFKDYYDKYLIDAELPAYDIETNAKDPRSDIFRIIGYSLSPNGSTGIYVIRESLDYKMPDDDWNKCIELTKNYISSHKVLVHNIMYERPSTINEWGINITNFEDSLIKARLLLGGKTGAGLKEQCTRNLGYPDWDTDLHVYLDRLETLCSKMKPTSSGRVRYEYEVMKDKGFVELLSILSDKHRKSLELDIKYKGVEEDSIPKEDKLEIVSNKLDSRQIAIKESLETLVDLISDYYDNINSILELIGKEVINLVDIQHEGIITYGSVPMNIITKYGALDSVATQDLNNYLSKRMDNESTSEVDLWKGYDVLKNNFIVGTDMEMNGLYWNDTVAESVRSWLSDKAYHAMIDMLRSGFLDKNIFCNSREYLLNHIRNNELEKVRNILGDFDILKSGIRLKDGKRVTWNRLLDYLGNDFINSYYDFIVNKIKSELENKDIYPDYESLKYLFNPSSNLIKDDLRSIFIDKDIKIAFAVHKIISDIKSGIDVDSIPNPDKQLYKEYINLTEYNSKVESGEISGSVVSTHDIFEKLKCGIDCIRPVTKNLRSILRNAAIYDMNDTSEPTIVSLYDCMSVMGYDIEDESTWDDRFKFLINFRTYKKCIKLISSYIDGDKVGRGSVFVVNREDIDNNTKLPIRKRKFSKKSDREEYLMQAYWGVCTATTLRWRSGIHTIPSGPMIKSIYTSRYKGGIIAAPDYSQQEIRTVAGLSNCTSLLEAYRNGEDVHMRTAMSVFKKPADQITKNERRFCKMCTFGILYGASAQGLADLTNSTVEDAQSMMDGFYSAYPELKVWMDARHKEVESGGIVSCPKVGYFLSIDPSASGLEEAYRQAGNAPVQGQSSLIAGYVLGKINQYLVDNNMMTKPISFIHDSLEFDIHPSEIFSACKKITNMMNDIPNQKFGIPSKAELTIGISMGDENEVISIEGNDKEGGVIILKGYEDDLNAILENWRKVYSVVDIEDDPESIENVYIPRKEMFLPKLTISKYSGTTRKLVKRKFIIEI